MRMVFWGLLVVVVAFLAYVRLAPTDVEQWHQSIDATTDKDFAGGALRVLDAPDDALAKLDVIAQQTPRTKRIAGSPEDGRMTFETRSLWIGFPDYTTVELIDGQLRIYARLRFGKADLSVNRKRVTRWIEALKS